MTDLDVLKNFAASAYQLAASAKVLSGMAKQANAQLKAAVAAIPAPLSGARLQKAASAVAKLYADRASVTPESLQKIWGADHNTLVDSLYKVASDSISNKIQEPGMVSVRKPPVAKNASAQYSAVSVDAAAHRKAFDDIFGIR